MLDELYVPCQQSQKLKETTVYQTRILWTTLSSWQKCVAAIIPKSSHRVQSKANFYIRNLWNQKCLHQQPSRHIFFSKTILDDFPKRLPWTKLLQHSFRLFFLGHLGSLGCRPKKPFTPNMFTPNASCSKQTLCHKTRITQFPLIAPNTVLHQAALNFTQKSFTANNLYTTKVLHQGPLLAI